MQDYLVTFAQVDKFMEADTTHTNLHSDLHKTEDDYRCLDFAAELKERANAEGIRCALCLIIYGDKRWGKAGNHVMVAMDTVDEGIVYYEPQVHNKRISGVDVGENLQIQFYEADEKKDPSYDRYANDGGNKAFVDAHVIFEKMLIW